MTKVDWRLTVNQALAGASPVAHPIFIFYETIQNNTKSFVQAKSLLYMS